MRRSRYFSRYFTYFIFIVLYTISTFILGSVLNFEYSADDGIKVNIQSKKFQTNETKTVQSQENTFNENKINNPNDDVSANPPIKDDIDFLTPVILATFLALGSWYFPNTINLFSSRKK